MNLCPNIPNQGFWENKKVLVTGHTGFKGSWLCLWLLKMGAKVSGIRTLSSKAQMDEANTTLQGKAKVKKLMWSRRAQEYETKINSGSLVSLAEVVRDLYKKEDQGEQSYSERQMYQAALERLAGEFAAVQNVDKSDAATKLEKIIDDSAEEAA